MTIFVCYFQISPPGNILTACRLGSLPDNVNVEYEVQMTDYNRDNKREVAKLIKDIFSIGIAEVFENLEKLPYTLSRGPSLTKAKRISNELAKQDILTEVKESGLQSRVSERF